MLTAVAILVGSGVLTRYARGQHGKRLRTDVLTELEILIKAQATCLMIVPNVLRGLTVLPGTYALVPVIDVVKSLTMAHATTGKTYEPRTEGRDSLGQVFAKPMSLEGIVRKEAYHVYGNAVLFQRCQHQSDLTLRGFLVNNQRQGIASPVLTFDLYLLFCEHLALVIDKAHQQLILASILAADKDREVELLEWFSHQSTPPCVIECVLLGQEHIVGIVFAQRLCRADADRMIALPCGRCVPPTMVVGGVLEITVLNKFRIKATIGSIADVLEENTHQSVADRLLL